MLKRALDVSLAFVGLVALWPILLGAAFVVWIQDHHSPIYWAPRVGKDGKIFYMAKLRSMIWNADSNRVDSTARDDPRITTFGHVIRRYKLDELTQLWNVLVGDMSLVGPRPNVLREVRLYTPRERELLSVKPGITDFASIVFSDLDELLKGSSSPDLDYNRIVRPRKSVLGLFYIDSRNLWIDLQLIAISVTSVLSRTTARNLVLRLLRRSGGSNEILLLASRESGLAPMAPPGSDKIVESRNELYS